MKRWTVFSRDGASVFIDFHQWDEAKARQWMRENERWINEPKSALYGAQLRLHEIETAPERNTRLVADLAMLVRQLAVALRRATPGDKLADKAVDYLVRNNLQGSALREVDPEKDSIFRPVIRAQVGKVLVLDSLGDCIIHGTREEILVSGVEEDAAKLNEERLLTRLVEVEGLPLDEAALIVAACW